MVTISSFCKNITFLLRLKLHNAFTIISPEKALGNIILAAFSTVKIIAILLIQGKQVLPKAFPLFTEPNYISSSHLQNSN